MAIIRNSIFGSISGKVGEGVSYKLNGQEVLRSLPSKRTAPLTAKEKNNRLKFAVSQAWLAPLIHYLRIGFKGYQPTYEGFVAAKSYNHKNALRTNDAGEFFIDPALALISYGTLVLPHSASATCTSEYEIVVTWEKDYMREFLGFVMLVLYDIDKGFAYGTIERVAGKDTVKYAASEGDIGDEYHIYLSFVSIDMKSRSNSMYLGKITII